MSSNRAMFQLMRNLTLLGPPGSGKGTYGRILASHWDVPLVTTSTVLRVQMAANPHMGNLLGSGTLVDCQSVSDALLKYLARHHLGQRYILDGFPRTPLQIDLMERDWPNDYQIGKAVLLDIPDEVCEQKMLGRRFCHRCEHYVNVANVQCLGFDLPPIYPIECLKSHCNPVNDWSTREDDQKDIIVERLRVHRLHEGPIVDYYAQRGALITFTPYRGIADSKSLIQHVEQWLNSLD